MFKKIDVSQTFKNRLFYSLLLAPIAQPVEHMTVNHGVVGSSPTGGVLCSNQLVGSYSLFALCARHWHK
jgi:hypothetical protein